MVLLFYLLTYRPGERLNEMRRVIEEELQRSFSDSPSGLVLEPVDTCHVLFTGNIERSCAQTDNDYQLGQVPDGYYYHHRLIR